MTIGSMTAVISASRLRHDIRVLRADRIAVTNGRVRQGLLRQGEETSSRVELWTAKCDGCAVWIEVIEQAPDLLGRAVATDAERHSHGIGPQRPAIEKVDRGLVFRRGGKRDVEAVAGDPLLQLGRRPFGDDAAVGHDRHLVGEPVGFLEVLGRQENSDAGSRKAADRRPHGLPAPQIEPRRRLVEEQHLWFRHQARCDIDASPHASRVRRDAPVAGVGEIERLEQLLGSLPSRRPRLTGEPTHHDQVLAAGLEFVEGDVLRHQADPAPDLRTVADHVEPGHEGLAGVGLQQRRQDAHRGGLAGAVRTQQGVDRPGRNAQIDAVEHPRVAV